MISSFTATTKMLTILFVVLFSLNLYIVNCEIMENMDSMNNKDSMIVPSNTDTSNENDQTLWELADSGEHGATGEMHNLDYLTKLKLLELFLNEIKRKEQLLQQLTKSRNQNNFISNSKRSFLRAMKDSDRKRPGWELAYGRRKRSIV